MFFLWETFSKVKKALNLSEDNVLKGNSLNPNAQHFTPGVIYEATVSEVVQPNNLVFCEGHSGTSHARIPGHCIWAAGVMSGMLGFKTNYTPPKGSKVLVLIGSTGVNYIVGGYLPDSANDLDGIQRSVVGGDTEGDPNSEAYTMSSIFNKLRAALLPKNQHNMGAAPAWDLVDGELEITNTLGVGALFLRQLAQLKGSDLAKIECFLIDDMVRIVSQTYKHYSAFGDFKIYNDGGKLNVQWDGTSSDWEAYGLSELEDRGTTAKIEEGDIEKTLKVTENNSEKDAKWRFSQFVGFLGDFINMFVTDPAVWESSDTWLRQVERSGKFRFHVNDDGTAIASTVNEFVIEKVCRIAVPLEQRREYDPEANNPATDLRDLLQYLTTWDFSQSGGNNNIHYTIYQIRDYAKWLSNAYSKAQFLRLAEDWIVPSESEVPEPDTIGQKNEDKTEANQEITHPEGVINSYATIKIAKDGSILLLDAYDNAVTLSKSGIELSSHNNVKIESAGSINMVSGRDINLVAKNSIDVTAAKGGYSVRAENFIQNYCQSGGILFESSQQYTEDISELSDSPNADQLEPERIKGIVFKTLQSDIRLESGKSLGMKAGLDTLVTARNTCAISASRANINETIEVFPKGASTIVTQGNLIDDANTDRSLGFVRLDGWLVSENILTNFLAQYAEDLRPALCPDEDKDGFLIGEDRVIANAADVAAGKADNVGDFMPGDNAFCHPFHVLTQNKKKWQTQVSQSPATKYKTHITTAKFVHRKKSEYGTAGSTDGTSSDAIYQTLTQQAILADLINENLNTVSYDDELWNLYLRLNDTSRGTPWPGVQNYLKYNATKKMWEPDETRPENYLNTASELDSGAYIMKTVKN